MFCLQKWFYDHQVNDPVPKPLRELQQRKGPGRPLPPTPDDDDTMRRAGSGAQLSSGIQRLDSSPGLANNRGAPGANSSQVMPDLLPQQSSGVTPTSGGIIRTSEVGSSGAIALQVRFDFSRLRWIHM